MNESGSRKESRNANYSFLDNLIEGCQIIDCDMRYLYLNDAALEHAHYPREQLIGRTMSECYPGIEDTLVYSKIQDVIKTSQSLQMENEFTYPDGQTGWFELRIDPVPDGVFILSLDITRRKLTEQKNTSLKAQLSQAQKMESIGRLAGGVAHDFNNMLNVILGYSELALNKIQQGEPFFREFTEIRTSANRAAELTRQLLGFARRQTIAPKKLDLNETVGGMINMLGRLIGENIELVWLPRQDLWSVHMDPSQIDQIMANMCVNARDAIDDIGKLVIETDQVIFDEDYCQRHAGFIPGEFVMLAITDNGCGIERETLEKIFEPFFTTKELGKGTGLGLAMVYGIVKQNHGFINVYSEPGQGACFKIYFPRHKDGVEQHVATKPLPSVEQGHETILLVEDEATLLQLIQAMLEELGYQILVAGSPDQAIQLLDKHANDIDLLMTDVIMPNMNGQELASHALKVRPEIRVLFTSGYTANVIAHHGVLDEGVNFLQKPFLVEELARKLRQTLEST